jgi:predicted transcriptional regulator
MPERDERMTEALEVSDDHEIVRVGRSVSTDTRLRILRLLLQDERSITEIAQAIGATEANASAQVKVLLESGLLECRYEPGKHGLKKLCRTRVKQIIIDL